VTTRPTPPRLAGSVLVCAAIFGLVPSIAAQSVADRTPNLHGGWIAAPGVVQFNFVHRFEVTGPPLRKLINAPTFHVAAGLTRWAMVGLAYAPNSELIANYPNEWEFLARIRPLAMARGFPADIAVQAAHNVATQSADAEIQLGRILGPVRLLGVGRAFWHPDSTRWAVGAGAVVRVAPWLAVAGDWATLIERRPDERAAWGVGLQFGVPYTPHSVSLQASNVNAVTLGGASRGTRTRVGFEYTVPITIGRYVGGRGAARPPPAPMADTLSRGRDTVRVGIRDLKYGPTDLVVIAGTTVRWVNEDPLAHTVTGAENAFDSGLLEPGAAWVYTFDAAGVYDYSCTPHPFMRGRVVVRTASGERE
jgi:plastocyanin